MTSLPEYQARVDGDGDPDPRERADHLGRRVGAQALVAEGRADLRRELGQLSRRTADAAADAATSLEAATVAMLETAGVCGDSIYAHQHSGGLLPRPDGSFPDDADGREWQAAVDRYVHTNPSESVDDEAELAKAANCPEAARA